MAELDGSSGSYVIRLSLVRRIDQRDSGGVLGDAVGGAFVFAATSLLGVKCLRGPSM
jgi:hypothetical protein